MLTKQQIQSKQSQLFQIFVLFDKNIDSMEKLKQTGKNQLQNMLDNVAEQHLLQKRLPQLTEPVYIELYQQSITKLQQMTVQQLVRFSQCCQNIKQLIHKLIEMHKMLSILNEASLPLILVAAETQRESEYIKIIQQTIEYIHIAAEGYTQHIQSINITVKQFEAYVLADDVSVDSNHLKYRLLTWVYEPCLREGFYKSFKDCYASIHQIRSLLLK